jgi:hypothetical protein
MSCRFLCRSVPVRAGLCRLVPARAGRCRSGPVGAGAGAGNGNGAGSGADRFRSVPRSLKDRKTRCINLKKKIFQIFVKHPWLIGDISTKFH